MSLRANILLIPMLVGAVFAAQGQSKDKNADTVKIKPSYIPTGVRVGTDLISYVRTAVDDTYNGWEFNADVDFYRYYFAVDYGHWGRDFVSDGQAIYTNSGNYWRVGADVNFLTKDPDRNMFFLGLRYGRSKFDERMAVTSEDPVWGTLDQFIVNQNVPAGWFELTTGLRVKVWKIFWLGYTARLKFGLSVGDTEVMKPSDVPGYGRADKESYWGFNYQVFIRLPVRKTPSLPTLKK